MLNLQTQIVRLSILGVENAKKDNSSDFLLSILEVKNAKKDNSSGFLSSNLGVKNAEKDNGAVSFQAFMG